MASNEAVASAVEPKLGSTTRGGIRADSSDAGKHRINDSLRMLVSQRRDS